MTKISTSVWVGASLIVVTPSSSITSGEEDLHEQDIQPIILDEEHKYLHLSQFAYHSSFFYLEDGKSVNDPALFDQLDVLEARSLSVVIG